MAKKGHGAPWGYRKIYLKDQGREVFEPSDFIKEFTKPIEKELKKKVGKFPTVKSCLKPHLKRPYLFICDIEDAFGSVMEDELLYKTRKDTELRRFLEDDKYLVIDVLYKKFQVFLDDYFESLKKDFFNDEEMMNEYFDDSKVSTIDSAFEIDACLPRIDYDQSRLPSWLKNIIFIKDNGMIKNIIGYESYEKEIQKRLDIGEKREDIIFEIFQPNKVLKKIEVASFLYLEFILNYIPISKKAKKEIIKKKKNLLEYLGDFKFLTLIETHELSIGMLKRKFSKNSDYMEVMMEQAEKFYFVMKKEYPEIDYFIENNINIKHYKKTGMKIHKKFAFLLSLRNRASIISVDDYKYWDWIEEKSKIFFGWLSPAYWHLKKFEAPVSSEKIFLDIFKKGGYNKEKSYIYKYGRFNFTLRSEDKKINLFHEAGFGLIQGSNLAPLLFEFYCQRTIDRDLKKLAKEYKVRYTRYRDDLIFSSRTTGISRKFRRKVRDILLKHYFLIKNKKTKIVNLNKKGSSVKVLGTVLTKKSIDVPNEIYERIDKVDNLSAEYQGLKNWVDYVKSIYWFINKVCYTFYRK